MILRQFCPDDFSGIFSLWSSVFGDGEDFVRPFLENIVVPGRGFVAIEDETVAAAAFIVDGIHVSAVKHPYIYAVSTLPEFRGRGFGKAVSLACAQLISKGDGVPCLHPAEPSLFDWYAEMGFHPAVSIREGTVTLSSAPSESVPLTKIAHAEYGALRRSMLSGVAFADFSDKLLRWQASLGISYYAFDGGCFAAHSDGEKMIVPELLANNNALSALQTLCSENKIYSCTVRTPALSRFDGFGPQQKFVSVASQNTNIGYWGFVFD